MIKLIDIRSGEWARALYGFFMLLLAVGAITVVKSVRDAIFLSRFSVTQLSFIAIGLAVATSFIVTVYLRYSAGLTRHRLIALTNGVVAVSLFGIYLGLGVPAFGDVMPWLLYIWSSIFGVFLVMQFWLLAGDLFDPREAKRLFGFVGAGAILGGIVGGVLSRWLAALVGSNVLLLIAAMMLLVEGFLARLVWPLRRVEREPPRPRRAAEKEQESQASGFRTLLEHRYVGLLALALLLSTVATTLLDWQFKGIVKAEFAGRTDAMASYFGTLYAYLSAASFALQTFFTGWILRRFGVKVGLMLLPLSVIGGSVAIAATPFIAGLTRLLAASGAKVAEGGLRFAIDKASTELMWMPVPGHVKEQGKAFVDTVMDRLGTGVTGVIWLALAFFGFASPERIHFISYAVIAMGVLWLAVLLRARGAYVDAFRQVLQRRELDLEGLSVGLMDAEARATVARTMQSDDPRQQEFALYLLEHGWAGPLPDLSKLLHSDRPEVVLRAMRLLRERDETGQREHVLSCLASPSIAVRRGAISHLRQTAAKEGVVLLEQLRSAQQVDEVVIHILQLGFDEQRDVAQQRLRQVLASRGEQRLELIGLLGAAPEGAAAELLSPLFLDPSPKVVHAALRAAGVSGDPQLVSPLMDLLLHRRYRPSAIAALRTLGEVAVPRLLMALEDEGYSHESRVGIVRVLGSSKTPGVGDALFAVASRSPELCSTALRALVRLQGKAGAGLRRRDLEQLLEVEVQASYRTLLALGEGSWPRLRQQPLPEALLQRVLRERVDERMERIFRLLALRFGAKDIRSAARGLRSPSSRIRASAMEFLDNMLTPELKARLLPLWEEGPPALLAEQAQRVLGLEAETQVELLRRLLEHESAVVRAAAAITISEQGLKELSSVLQQARAGSPPWLAPVIKRALHSLQKDDRKEYEMALTLIDKALKLQRVDVLARASTEDLAYVAQISQEEELPAGQTLYAAGDAPDALYVVLSGKVRLHLDDDEIAILEEGEAFGSWALVDESPRVTWATTMESTLLLKVEREEFTELLADRVNIVQAVFKAMVERVRALTQLAQG